MCDAHPGSESFIYGALHRIDAQQTDTTQNERQHGRRQVRSSRQTASGDAAAVTRGAEDGGQRFSTDGVYSSGPSFFIQRSAGGAKWAAIYDVVGAQALQIFVRPWAAGGRDDFVASCCQ